MLTNLEILALVVIVATAIKIFVVMVNPKSWLGFVERIYSYPAVMMFLSLVLSAVTLKYLLDSGIGIVQILAVMLFLGFLMMMSLAVYSKEILPIARKILKDRKFLSKAWLAIVVWVALIAWAVYVIFA